MQIFRFHESFLVVGVIATVLTNQGNALLLPLVTQKICGEVGTFTDAAPFDTLPLPQCPSDIGLNVTLVLYTRDNPIDGQVITQTYIPETFSHTRQTWFIVHGWASKEDIPIYYLGPWVEDLTNQALKQGDYNIIDVQWNSLKINYLQSASDTRSVGAQIALIAEKTLVAHGLPRTNLYCIGHSLGAHVCSFASQTYKFGRITGLDAAGPWFDFFLFRATPVGLGKYDADLVDVVHTDNLILGTHLARGKMDFYPITIGNLLPIYAHFIAPVTFISSISQPKECFLADSVSGPGQCFSGFYANECTTEGKFVIRISLLRPFCRITSEVII